MRPLHAVAPADVTSEPIPVRALEPRGSTVVERIGELEAQADAAEDVAIARKYEAARLIFEEMERRTSEGRPGGARLLADEIGKKHTHVLRMEWVHRNYGHRPHVRTIREWNRLYHKIDPQIAPQDAPTFRRRGPMIRTPDQYLREARLALKSAVRESGAEVVARAFIRDIGAEVIRRVLDDDAPEVPVPPVAPPALEVSSESLFGVGDPNNGRAAPPDG